MLVLVFGKYLLHGSVVLYAYVSGDNPHGYKIADIAALIQSLIIGVSLKGMSIGC